MRLVLPNGFRRTIGILVVSAVLLATGLVMLTAETRLFWNALGVAATLVAWLLPVILAVRYKTRSELRRMATGDDVRRAQRALTTAVDQSRKNLTTSGKRQERALLRIESHLRALSAMDQAKTFQSEERGIDVLFVTSNGAGLGHISRLLAIADHLPNGRSYEILTLSLAYRQAAEQGTTVHYFPSSEAAGEPAALWNKHFRAYFLRLVTSSRPRVVVFDGTWVYTPLTDVCRALGIPLVWVQRGMWRADIDAASTQRHDAGIVADRVIIPGDFAGDEVVDGGKKITLDYVGPIVRTSRDELLARDAACYELGLDASRKYVMLNLGGGGISDPGSLTDKCRELLDEISPDLTPVRVVSPLATSDDDVSAGVSVSAYPVMPYANAFEFMICAAGYNSAQEAVALGVPSILVPNAQTRTDDQVRRARELAALGLCFAADNEVELRQTILNITDPEQYRGLQRRLAEVEAPCGALEAAMLLDEVIGHAEWPRLATTIEGSIHNGA